MRRKIEVFDSIEDLSRAAAELFMDEAASALSRRGSFSVALSGGSTPAPLFSLLSKAEYRMRVNWERIHFFWADERCVPKDHPDSNFRLAFDLFLSILPVPDSAIHRIPGELIAEQAATEYERDLLVFFHGSPLPRFDLIFLGVGTDGHTASIFPNTRGSDDIARAVIPVRTEKLDTDRVSLTLPCLNNASTVVFLVAGKEKAGIVRDILEGDDTRYPAGRISPTRGRVIWLLDRHAAALLEDRRT